MTGQNAESILNEIRIKKLYLLDAWSPDYRERHYENAFECFKKFEGNKKVVLIKCNSLDIDIFPDNYFNYIYVDDLHHPDHVYKELKFYYPKLKKYGMIAGHDYRPDLPERVKAGVDKWIKETGYELHTYKNDSDYDNSDFLDWWVWKK